jgi:large subunit ribosomal protein L19
MWFKIYSPNVEGIEVVQRKEKRARRARLTYLRKKEHDRGSVQGVVDMYLRQRAAVRGGRREQQEKGKARKKVKGRK